MTASEASPPGREPERPAPERPAAEGYSAASRAFHWVSAALVLAAVPLGLAMLRVEPGAVQNALFDLHRSFGATILVVGAARVVHRLVRPPVRPAPGVPAWQQAAAQGVHWCLYALLLALPLIGWAGTSAFGAPISYFGLFTLPDLLAEDEELAETLLGLHGTLAFVLIGLVALHVGAVLHHHFVRRDAVLRRMLTGRA